MNVPPRPSSLRSCDWFIITTTLIVGVARSSGLLVPGVEDSLFVIFLSICTFNVLVVDIIFSVLWMTLTLSTEPFIVDEHEGHPVEKFGNRDDQSSKPATNLGIRGRLGPRKRDKTERSYSKDANKKEDENTTQSAPQLSNLSERRKTAKLSNVSEDDGAKSPPTSPFMKISPFHIMQKASAETDKTKSVASDKNNSESETTEADNASSSNSLSSEIPPMNNTALVIDIGSNFIRCGFAGESKPMLKINSSDAVDDINRRLAAASTNKIGRKASSSIYSETGKVSSVENYIEIIKYVYSLLMTADNSGERSGTGKGLRTIDSTKYPLLICWPACGPMEDAVKITGRLFEDLKVPLVHYAPAPVLALYASGRQTGCSVLSGDLQTTTVCVIDGLALCDTLISSLLAGKYVSDNLSKKLGTGKYVLVPLAGGVLRELKEKIIVCSKSRQQTAPRVQNHADHDENDSENENVETDGSAGEDGEPLTAEERKQCAEGLFRRKGSFLPAGGDSFSVEPLQNAVVTSITTAQTKYKIREGWWGNIVLSGGNAKIRNLRERLDNELKSNVQLSRTESICISEAQGDSANAVWLGGSVLAKLDGFGQDHWVSTTSFRENPREALGAKCQFLVANAN